MAESDYGAGADGIGIRGCAELTARFRGVRRCVGLSIIVMQSSHAGTGRFTSATSCDYICQEPDRFDETVDKAKNFRRLILKSLI